MEVHDKVALITGSGRGIGKAIALRLAQEGAHVVLNASKSIDEAKMTLSELPKKVGQEHSFIQADIKTPEQIFKMMDQINQRYGRLNILVNNAGTTRFIKHDQLGDLTTEIFDKIYQEHVRGTYVCVQHALPMLKKDKESLVVNIASIAAMTAVGSNIAYCAMKAALVNMTKSMARALAPGVRVNVISPGLTETELIKGWDEYKSEQISKTPLGRLATCEDIASAVYALVTSLEYMTGQNIVLDGGRILN
jgi:3-oxoacyl-[acyl-carrier protein] reductase